MWQKSEKVTSHIPAEAGGLMQAGSDLEGVRRATEQKKDSAACNEAKETTRPPPEDLR
jgi:hypothetical protein